MLQPLLCSKLAGNSSEFWPTLPLIQALLPGCYWKFICKHFNFHFSSDFFFIFNIFLLVSALRPNFNSWGQVDDSFSAWRQPFVQHALSQVFLFSFLNNLNHFKIEMFI